jgi:hypothetical protein
MTDIAAQMQSIQDAVGRFAALVGGLEAALPEDLSGWDDSRTVCVRIDRTGVPVGVVVRDEWSAALDPSKLGPAVVRAAGAAAAARAQALGEMLRDGAPGGASPGGYREDSAGLAGPAGAAGSPAPPPVPHEPRMPLGDLAEAAISALSRASAAPEPVAPPAGTGAGANGAVAIALSAGTLSSCVIDERWADGRSALQVTTALQHALDEARQSLSEAQQQGPAEGSLDDLLGEAMAHLLAITGRAQEQKGPTDD